MNALEVGVACGNMLHEVSVSWLRVHAIDPAADLGGHVCPRWRRHAARECPDVVLPEPPRPLAVGGVRVR